MTLSRSAFSNCCFVLDRPLYGPRRDRCVSVFESVSEDTFPGSEDGGEGGPEGPLGPDDVVVPLDELFAFESDSVAFPAREASERANLVSF